VGALKKTIAQVVVSALCGMAVFPACADDEKPTLLPESALGGKFTGTIAFTTEYFSRGKSNTRPGVPAVQGQLEFDHDSGGYFSVFGSNVDKAPPEDSGTVEIDYTAGFRSTVGNFGYDLYGVYTTYPGAHRADGLDFDFFEFTARADYDLAWAKPYVAVSWSPEYQYDSGTEWYYQTGVVFPIGPYVTGLARVGHSTFDNNVRALNNDYSDWGVAVATNVLGLDLKLEYVATDLPKTQCVSSCDRVVFTVSKTF
jgi:uncharacterized protein (TIGR02001 family)